MMQLESRCLVRAPGGETAIAHAKPAEAMGSPTEAAGSIFLVISPAVLEEWGLCSLIIFCLFLVKQRK